jgi:hypothetical protein
MTGLARHERDHACPGDGGHSVDRHLELALDHLVDFFLQMKVLMYGRALRRPRETVFFEARLADLRRQFHGPFSLSGTMVTSPRRSQTEERATQVSQRRTPVGPGQGRAAKHLGDDR